MSSMDERSAGSVIRKIQYGADQIQYERFDAGSTERFKFGEWTPRSITGGKMQWDPKSRVLIVVSYGVFRHDTCEVASRVSLPRDGLADCLSRIASSPVTITLPGSSEPARETT
jgi:hypothetical protein